MPRQRSVSGLCSGLQRRIAGLKLSLCTPAGRRVTAGREAPRRALRDRRSAKGEHPPSNGRALADITFRAISLSYPEYVLCLFPDAGNGLPLIGAPKDARDVRRRGLKGERIFLFEFAVTH